MDFATWLTFFAAAWAISLSPGPGAVAAMGSGLSHGFLRGYFTTFGLVLGIVTQVVVVGLGLGALISASATAFAVLKWLGVAYLIYLGVQQWRSPVAALRAPMERAQVKRRTLVLRGWMMNAVNPKGTVFMLAVVPQFVDPSAALLPQYALISATLVFTDLVVMAGYTALASQLLKAFAAPSHMRWLNRLFGGLFVLAGVVLAGFKRSSH